jgi:hypothetical protein
MLYPAPELVRTLARDRWLIKRSRPPRLKHQPASLLQGNITYISPISSQGSGYDYLNSAPKELIAEIDQAYFRQSLREEVRLWFKRRGFDLKQRTIPKHLFEAAVQAEFGSAPV